MILGIGMDIVDLQSFQEQLDDLASTFVAGTFTPSEQRNAKGHSHPPTRHLAARFAAKEAFIKAWSSANWGHPPDLSRVDMREIEVLSDPWGRPALTLHGAVAQILQGRYGATRTHVSLTHDGGFAAATVVLERCAQ